MPDKIELDDKRVIKEYHKLKSIYKVSKIFNCSVTPIQRVLNRNKIEYYGFRGLGGKENPNYGNKWTEKMKKSLSEKKKGKTYEELYGKEKAREIKKKLSEKFSGKGNPFYGKTHSKEFREWSSKKHKGKKISEEQKRIVSEKLKGIPKNHGYKISEFYKSNLNNYSEERKQKAREKIIQRMKEGKVKKVLSKPEMIFKEELLKNNINFIEQFNIENFLFDFAIMNKRILIEVDGDYWHYNPKLFGNKNPDKIQKMKIKIDEKKKLFAEKNNWLLLRFWESDIKKDVKSCVDKIENAIQSR